MQPMFRLCIHSLSFSLLHLYTVIIILYSYRPVGIRLALVYLIGLLSRCTFQGFSCSHAPRHIILLTFWTFTWLRTPGHVKERNLHLACGLGTRLGFTWLRTPGHVKERNLHLACGLGTRLGFTWLRTPGHVKERNLHLACGLGTRLGFTWPRTPGHVKERNLHLACGLGTRLGLLGLVPPAT